MNSVEIVERYGFARIFRVKLDGDPLYHSVGVDGAGKVWVGGKRLNSSGIGVRFDVGQSKAEIFVDHWPLLMGPRLIWFVIDDQTVYFDQETNEVVRSVARIHDSVLKTILSLVVFIIPAAGVVGGLAGTCIVQLLAWVHMPVTIAVQWWIQTGIAVLVGANLAFDIYFGRISSALLVENKSIEAIEKERSWLGLPFGLNYINWLELKSKVRPGDEIWVWRTSDASWKNLSGRDGLVIVRDGKPTKHSMVTGMN